MAPKEIPIGSPGNKNPAVLDYDPSGLRSSMSATWAALDIAVVERAAPNHLPTPEWWKDLAFIEAECDRKGHPYVMGRKYSNKTLSANYNDVRW